MKVGSGLHGMEDYVCYGSGCHQKSCTLFWRNERMGRCFVRASGEGKKKDVRPAWLEQATSR